MPFRQGSSRYTVLADPPVDGPVAYRRARDRSTKRDVLLIRLPVAPPETTAQRRTLQIRAERVATSHSVTHPGASAFDEVFIEAGELYAVTPLPPGVPLRQADRRPDAARLAADLLDIVEVAHAAGHGHGWIDPDSVWIEPGGGVHLIGLGVRELAILLRAPDDCGDPAYRAPETRVGEDPGPAADLYGIGAVTHFALVGRAPDGRELPGPAALASVLGQLLAPEPADRPWLGDVRAALDAVGPMGEPGPATRSAPMRYAPPAWEPDPRDPTPPDGWSTDIPPGEATDSAPSHGWREPLDPAADTAPRGRHDALDPAADTAPRGRHDPLDPAADAAPRRWRDDLLDPAADTPHGWREEPHDAQRGWPEERHDRADDTPPHGWAAGPASHAAATTPPSETADLGEPVAETMPRGWASEPRGWLDDARDSAADTPPRGLPGDWRDRSADPTPHGWAADLDEPVAETTPRNWTTDPGTDPTPRSWAADLRDPGGARPRGWNADLRDAAIPRPRGWNADPATDELPRRVSAEPATRRLGADESAFPFPAPRLPEPLPPTRSRSRAAAGRSRRGLLIGGGVMAAGVIVVAAVEGVRALGRPGKAAAAPAPTTHPTATTPGARVWTQAIPPELLRRPRLLDGVILVEASDMVVLRTGDGSLAWKLLGGAHHLTVADGVLYVQQGNDAQRTLSAVAAADGSVAYTVNIDGSIQALTVAAGTGFLLGGPHEAAVTPAYLRSIDVRSGHVNWTFPGNLNLGNYPIVDDTHVYAGGPGVIWALDRGTGDQAWRLSLPDDPKPSPRGIAGGLLIVRAHDGTYAVDPAKGKIRWRVTGPDVPYLSSQAAVDGDTLYLSSGATTGGRVRAVRAADGHEQWQVTVDAAPSHAMTSGGVVYVTGGPTLDALAGADGSVRWRCPLDGGCQIEPVAGDGLVFAATSTGKLHAVRAG